jgi:hypothetical protein
MNKNHDGNLDAYATIVETNSGSIYEISFVDGDWKVAGRVKQEPRTENGLLC